MENTELDPSELGTQSYWHKYYARDLENYVRHGDEGEVWYGEDCMNRVIDWFCKDTIKKATAILDLGSGNGRTLSALGRLGFRNMTGVDYCQDAVTLAEKVTQPEFPDIKYKKFDIIKDNTQELGKFGIVHDKGTYDAIALNPQNPKRCRERYIEQVENLLEDEGRTHKLTPLELSYAECMRQNIKQIEQLLDDDDEAECNIARELLDREIIAPQLSDAVDRGQIIAPQMLDQIDMGQNIAAPLLDQVVYTPDCLDGEDRGYNFTPDCLDVEDREDSATPEWVNEGDGEYVITTEWVNDVSDEHNLRDMEHLLDDDDESDINVTDNEDFLDREESELNITDDEDSSDEDNWENITPDLLVNENRELNITPEVSADDEIELVIKPDLLKVDDRAHHSKPDLIVEEGNAHNTTSVEEVGEECRNYRHNIDAAGLSWKITEINGIKCFETVDTHVYRPSCLSTLYPKIAQRIEESSKFNNECRDMRRERRKVIETVEGMLKEERVNEVKHLKEEEDTIDVEGLSEDEHLNEAERMKEAKRMEEAEFAKAFWSNLVL